MGDLRIAESEPNRAEEAPILADYMRILRERRSAILGILITVVAATMVVTFLVPPQYRATATVQIERKAPEILEFREVLSADASGYNDFYQTQYRILQSRAVQRIAADRLGLVHRPEFATRKSTPLDRMRDFMGAVFGKEPAEVEPIERATEFFSDGMRVKPIEHSHLVKVSFTDRDPELARDAANAIVEAYEQFSLDARYSTTAQASEFLTKQVTQTQAEIRDLEQQLQEYRAQKQIVPISADTQDMGSQALADLNTRHVAARGRLAEAEARYNAVRDAAPEGLPEVLKSPLITNLRQRYAESERRYRKMEERFKPDWPDLRALREELLQSEERLELEMESLANQVRSVARADYRQARAEVAALARRLEEQKRELQRNSGDVVEYAALQAEIDTRRRFLEGLVGRQKETEVSDRLRDSGASNVRLVDRAELPRSPVKPNKPLNLLLSVLFGSLSGVAVAVVLHQFDSSVKSTADAERLARVNVIGWVPPAEATAEPSGDSEFAEAFKNLRTSLLLAVPDHPWRTIVVTSAEPGDGKSTITTNLAKALAQMGRKVLLIDADLRRPRIHQAFDLDNGKGLSTLLAGYATFSDTVLETETKNLSVLPAGPVPPTPSELLDAPGLQLVIDRALAADYDHVIFDSTPLLQVPDAVILSARTDVALVVVRCNKTRRDSLQQAVARLSRIRASIVGMVLNEYSDPTLGRYPYYGRPSGGTGESTEASSRKRRRKIVSVRF